MWVHQKEFHCLKTGQWNAESKAPIGCLPSWGLLSAFHWLYMAGPHPHVIRRWLSCEWSMLFERARACVRIMRKRTILQHLHDVLFDQQDDLASQPAGDPIQGALPHHCVAVGTQWKTNLSNPHCIPQNRTWPPRNARMDEPLGSSPLIMQGSKLESFWSCILMNVIHASLKYNWERVQIIVHYREYTLYMYKILVFLIWPYVLCSV